MARKAGATLSPIYDAAARSPVECPDCMGLFEAPFEVAGVRVRGHVPGGRDCPARIVARPAAKKKRKGR